MNKNEMRRCFYSVMEALSKFDIESKAGTPSTRKTFFFFKNCMGEDVINEAYKIYHNNYGN